VPVGVSRAARGTHIVGFYGNDEQLVAAIDEYLELGPAEKDVAVVVATPGHREALLSRFAANGIDVQQARRSGSLVCLDAEDTLAAICIDGKCDPPRFDETVGTVIRSAAARGGQVRAFGEMVALLWQRGDVVATMELERLWNALAGEVSFSLFCAYPAPSGIDDASALDEVCALHTAVCSPPIAVAARTLTGQSWRFRPEFDGPRAARRVVVEALIACRCGDDLVDAAALVVSELACNAVIHAGSLFTVYLTPTAAGVRISVRDASQDRPIHREGSSSGLSGRGLALVNAVARSWGVNLLADGTLVWAELG
jgi:anti-sigma regulatory factor (Ser/Thr protein kinase)